MVGPATINNAFRDLDSLKNRSQLNIRLIPGNKEAIEAYKPSEPLGGKDLAELGRVTKMRMESLRRFEETQKESPLKQSARRSLRSL